MLHARKNVSAEMVFLFISCTSSFYLVCFLQYYEALTTATAEEKNNENNNGIGLCIKDVVTMFQLLLDLNGSY